MSMRWEKLGLIYRRPPSTGWWHSHTMAPSAVLLDDEKIRVFLGCWDKAGISRIGYIDVRADRPTEIIALSGQPVLEIGAPGTFDDNGVFPAHAAIVGDAVYLYYTGFQLGHKVRYFNFGGLAISRDHDNRFERVSQAPVLDRADEGLTVRAGQSVLLEDGVFHTVYSAGSGWSEVGGIMRPHYDVYYQASADGISYARTGRPILRQNTATEHGLGRPQLTRLGRRYAIFHTRRTLDFHYHFGLALSDDLREWARSDHLIQLPHGDGFDSEMVYFPSLLHVPHLGRYYLFYSGNQFGRDGLGVAEIHLDESWN